MGSSSSVLDMPLFRKKKQKETENDKQKLAHKLYLAQEKPGPVFDIAACNLSDVPEGVFSLCKVLRKESLLICDNELKSLTGGGKLNDLSMLRVLDVHNNCLSSLPEQISKLSSLEVLNVQNNRLCSLPDSLSQLQHLQKLNVKGNSLQCLPSTFNKMKRLKMLDISENKIRVLDKSFSEIRTLEVLVLDADIMEYPASGVCLRSTESIKQFLCTENGVTYIPPCEFVVEPTTVSPSKHAAQHLLENTAALVSSVAEYESLKEKKRKEALAIEKELEEASRQQTWLLSESNKMKSKILDTLAEDHVKMTSDIEKVAQKKDVERQKLLISLHDVERSATDLINNLITMNAAASKKEAILEAMEKERMEAEELFLVRHEEAANLREKDILQNMELMLANNNTFEQLRKSYEDSRIEMARQGLMGSMKDSDELNKKLAITQQTQHALVLQLMQQEEFQRNAFEVLQRQKDVHHQRLTNEIAMLSVELEQLSVVEVGKRYSQSETQSLLLEEKRLQLTKMLMQLMTEKEKREKELAKRLVEMEQRRKDDVKDYWLIQYQRLLDRKPQDLVDQETHLEWAVLYILEEAQATEYIPMFARHRISIETMYQLTDQDLSEIGIGKVGIRKTILRVADERRKEEETAKQKADKLFAVSPTGPESPLSGTSGESRPPSAPPEEEVSASAPAVPGVPDVQPPSLVARVHAECVVCLDNQCTVVFLMCGHVCCCSQCSAPLSLCPLCRGTIEQRIELSVIQ